LSSSLFNATSHDQLVHFSHNLEAAASFPQRQFGPW
jgi:hypothetical protein